MTTSHNSDGGDNWIPMDNGLTNTSIETLVFDPITPTILYAATYGGGVFRYESVNACNGDLNGDGDVDGSDLAEFAYVYANEHSDADLNGDTFIDTKDIEMFAEEFGRTDCL